MGGNRFDFLELGEEDNAPRRPGGGDADSSESPIGRDPTTERGAKGEPLAQVVDFDTRGYRTYLAQTQAETEAAHKRRTPGTLRAVEVFGERGSRAGQFNSPMGLAVDRGGILFIADSYNHRVQRITPDGGVSPLGGRGGGHGQFLSPQAVATDAADAFYIVEQGNHRVQKFGADGGLQLVFGRSGTREGEFRGPTSIAVAPGSGDIYVADSGNGRVQRFDPHGNFLGLIAGGSPGGMAFSPQALATDVADNLYIADPFANHVLRYDPLGRSAGQFAQFRQPRALACDQGVLYVADAGDAGADLSGEASGRLVAWQMAQGRTLTTVERVGRRLGRLSRPGGVAVAPATADGSGRGDVYVADTMNHRILRFLWE